MFPAIVRIAVSAFGPRQALAFIAGWRLIFLRFLRSPPCGMLLVPDQRPVRDVRVARITGGKARIATRTGVVLAMLRAD